MCCGSAPKRPKQNAQAPPVEVQEVNQNVAPAPSNIINDNINSQRAAQINRVNYHRLRFRNSG